ncbi:GNAT family acetyltransferase [Peribacillus simplex]|uniref:GNAT family acetyltransferase n=1 Tax=Peribacillus simplex TaxID=1478 RepID=A0A120GQV7_9BACI|nr:GNAT family N-acetyltransferase [Peribacillus simplex]KWW21931.1 GNAT family acetyltransferase [Peribacillus simplex]
MSIIIIEQKHIEQDDLKSLYDDVEWYAYTKDLNQLQQALIQSLYVVSAWEHRKLIGLTRVVGDGLTIVYVQDILVLNAYQNQGIATLMMQHVLEKYKDVRQKVLLTEEAPDVRHFYEKNGFQSCDKGALVAFAKLD